uniref:AMIN domain-containing protein n=1 Tax=Cronobacter sakazakii TaxID=28141 RepID=UPI000AF1D2B8
MRVWPASAYTRVTLESNRVPKYRQFALSKPERPVVDPQGVHLNAVRKGGGSRDRLDRPAHQPAPPRQF